MRRGRCIRASVAAAAVATDRAKVPTLDALREGHEISAGILAVEALEERALAAGAGAGAAVVFDAGEADEQLGLCPFAAHAVGLAESLDLREGAA